MATVFMTDPVTGRCALYDEPVLTGDVDNPNAPRNAPLNSPATNLPFLYFHSDFNYLEVSHGPVTVGVNHDSISVPTTPPGATVAYGWNSSVTDRLLFTHSLGYPPLAMVALGANVLWPGMPVQVTTDGGSRYASIYTTATQVRMKEFASIGVSAIPAATLNYTTLVFRNPPAPSGNILFDFDPTTGYVMMGLEKFDSSRRYLQVVSGGTPFGVSYGGRTIDLANGAPKAWRPDGTSYTTVPAALTLALGRFGLTGTNWGYVFGSSMSYNGSYAGPPGNIEVQAP